MNNIPSLYLHIPFCSTICSYCDFYKMVAKEEVKTKYIGYLVKEIEMKSQYFTDLKTIYIGGGTPSCLSLNLLDYLLYHLHHYIDFSKIEEFTLEANPNDINKDLVLLLKKYQVNRVSLGVQSFNPEVLKILRRNHQESDIKRATRILRENGIDNINLDIIYGVGTEKWKTVLTDLKKAIKYGAKHISAYSLIIEDKTMIKKWLDEGRYQRADEDQEAAIYQKIVKFLKRKGFIHYEISNFSKKNMQSKHNLVYWDNINYIGAGAGASYYLNNIRYTNIKNLDSYFKGIDSKILRFSEVTKLSKQEIMGEEMMLGLRRIQGINLVNFKEKFGVDAYQVFPIINRLIALKLLAIKDNYLFIPEKKLYLSNEVLVNFI